MGKKICTSLTSPKAAPSKCRSLIWRQASSTSTNWWAFWKWHLDGNAGDEQRNQNVSPLWYVEVQNIIKKWRWLWRSITIVNSAGCEGKKIQEMKVYEWQNSEETNASSNEFSNDRVCFIRPLHENWLICSRFRQSQRRHWISRFDSSWICAVSAYGCFFPL